MIKGKTMDGKTRRFSKAILPLVLILALTGAHFSAGGESTNVDKKPETVDVVPAAIGRPLNPTPNPLTRCGPLGVTRLFVMVDRSHSVMSLAGGSFANVNATKDALKVLVDTVGQHAQDRGTDAYIYIQAFADTAVWQNGPDRYGNNFYSWIANSNIAIPAVREHVKNDVIGSNDDGIYFRRSYTQSRFKVVPGNPAMQANNMLRGYHDRPGHNGYTNYQAALEGAQGYVNLFSPVGTGPDDDTDLAFMITDGLPTANNIDASPGSGDMPNGNDIFGGAGATSGLRLGGFVQWIPTPVKAILVGSQANVAGADGYMNQVFGAGSYATVPSYANLSSTINSVIAPHLCAPQISVNPSIEVNSITAVPTTQIQETGGSANIRVRVTNNGDIDLSYVRATTYAIDANGARSAVGPPQTLVQFGDRFRPGAANSIDITLGYQVSAYLGIPGPMRFEVEVTSAAVLGPMHTVVSGSNAPADTSGVLTIGIIREPLPA